MAENDPDNLAPKICELCFENSGKYCCPRCSILFCSLNCYKSRNHAECSEGFYRDSIYEDLASYQVQDGSKEKMIEILKKMQVDGAGGDVGELAGATEDDNDDSDNDDSDDEKVVALYERIKGLDLENADALWESLTTDERNEFEAMISHGEIGHLMPNWEPWWLFKTEKQLVKNINKKMEEFSKMHRCPMHKKVPEMRALTKVEPSKAIRYNITNVLASYAFTLRYFQGEVDPVEWAIYFLDICNNLDKNSNYEDRGMAIESVVQNCLQSELIKTDKKSLGVMRCDTCRILQGPNKDISNHFCKSALSHIHRILARARVSTKKQTNIPKPETPKIPKLDSAKYKTFSMKFPEHQVKNLVKLDVDKLKKCLKKVEYYLSYVESYTMYEFDEE